MCSSASHAIDGIDSTKLCTELNGDRQQLNGRGLPVRGYHQTLGLSSDAGTLRNHRRCIQSCVSIRSWDEKSGLRLGKLRLEVRLRLLVGSRDAVTAAPTAFRAAWGS
jgi:hypothetical protein